MLHRGLDGHGGTPYAYRPALKRSRLKPWVAEAGIVCAEVGPNNTDVYNVYDSVISDIAHEDPPVAVRGNSIHAGNDGAEMSCADAEIDDVHLAIEVQIPWIDVAVIVQKSHGSDDGVLSVGGVEEQVGLGLHLIAATGLKSKSAKDLGKKRDNAPLARGFEDQRWVL